MLTNIHKYRHTYKHTNILYFLYIDENKEGKNMTIRQIACFHEVLIIQYFYTNTHETETQLLTNNICEECSTFSCFLTLHSRDGRFGSKVGKIGPK